MAKSTSPRAGKNERVKMIKPLANQVLIEPISEKEKTKSGIVLPDTAEKEESKKAKVLALGKIINQDGKEIKAEVKKGDVIVHDGFGREISEDKKEYQIIKYEDILAVIK
jgi:chaperonin GroES